MAKNPGLVFFGLFLIGMLFVPPSIPFMVPEASADSTYVHSVGTDKDPGRTLSYFANNGYNCPDGDGECLFRSPQAIATDSSIDDSTFVTGLQWLITNGIMVIG